MDILKLRKWSVRGLCVFFGLVCIYFVWMTIHLYKCRGQFGDFGLHVELLQKEWPIGIPGIKTGYALKVYNYSPFPITLEACQIPNDTSPFYQLEYRHHVERFDEELKKWIPLWKMPPDACPSEEFIHPQKVYLWPGSSEMVIGWNATAATQGLRIGDIVRFRVYSRFTETDESPNQIVLVSSPFTLHEQNERSEVPYRIKH